MKDHNDCCCQSMQGEQGPQGIQGPRGQDGLQGPQGTQGPQGVPGSCVNCFDDGAKHHHKVEFAEVFSSSNQSLSASPGSNLAGQVAIFENTIVASPGIDASFAAVNGKVFINVAGWYDVATGICGALNPLASPLPVWTLSLFKNGIIVAGSTFACMTLSPEQKSNEVTADVFVHLNAGEYLELANTSTAQISLTSPALGSNAVANSCYMKITLLKAD